MEQNDKVLAKALPLTPTGTAGAGSRVAMRGQDVVDSASDDERKQEPLEQLENDTDVAGSATRAATAHVEPELEAQEERRDSGKTPKKASNNVRRIRIERMMSKAELARRANLSVLTIDRVERGYGCRMDTKRKILEALGLSLADRVRVFGEEE
ncbi:MAG TPA: helix-turn-helix transcriptional regulator [Nitrospiraceae bacterium]|nr:helix-turn-helix transcriptional regulator [Nitrospiraceae bacterium]